jgi:hypothetical protein
VKKTLLVDGNNVLLIGFHGTRNLSNSGLDLYAFLLPTLLSILANVSNIFTLVFDEKNESAFKINYK